MAAHHRKKHDAFKSAKPENIQRRKTLSVILIIVIAFIFALVAYFVGRPLVREFIDSPENFRSYVKSHWLLGPVVMLGIMMMQVIVAVIPGEPFEVGAGFVFGWAYGSVLCLAGTALASALIYLAVRKWGIRLVELFFPREKILGFSFLQDEKRLDLLVFILFLIPGTPKDLLTYLVGLTPMKISAFLLLTTLARIPSVLSSTVTGSLAQKGSYKAAIITYGITLIITIICVIWYRKMTVQDKENKADEK